MNVPNASGSREGNCSRRNNNVESMLPSTHFLLAEMHYNIAILVLHLHFKGLVTIYIFLLLNCCLVIKIHIKYKKTMLSYHIKIVIIQNSLRNIENTQCREQDDEHYIVDFCNKLLEKKMLIKKLFTIYSALTLFSVQYLSGYIKGPVLHSNHSSQPLRLSAYLSYRLALD